MPQGHVVKQLQSLCTVELGKQKSIFSPLFTASVQRDQPLLTYQVIVYSMCEIIPLVGEDMGLSCTGKADSLMRVWLLKLLVGWKWFTAICAGVVVSPKTDF